MLTAHLSPSWPAEVQANGIGVSLAAARTSAGHDVIGMAKSQHPGRLVFAQHE